METTQPQGVTDAGTAACTNACTRSADSAHSEAVETVPTGPVGDHFAEAVAMLTRLPLTDAERAEAVRRLLVESGGTPPPEGAADPDAVTVDVDAE